MLYFCLMFEDFFLRGLTIFFHDRKIFFPLILSLFLCLALSIILWSRMPRTLSQDVTLLPLHYNIHFGVDYTGQWFEIFAVPAGGFVIFLINAVIIWFVYSDGMILSYFLSGASLFSSLTAFVAGVLILLINT